MKARQAVRIEKINYDGWQNCYRMTNGEVELVMTGDVGPRIIRYAFTGGRNVFHVFADQAGKSGESNWPSRRGHRVWVAPDDAPPSPITHAVDNFSAGIKLETD